MNTTTKQTKLHGINVNGEWVCAFFGKAQMKIEEPHLEKMIKTVDAVRIGDKLFVLERDTIERRRWDFEWESEKPAGDVFEEQKERLLQEPECVGVE